MQPDIQKVFVYFKKLVIAILSATYIYKLLATLNIVPRYYSMYRCRGRAIFCIKADPLKEFYAWVLISIVVTAILLGIAYYVSRREKEATDFKQKIVLNALAIILRYSIIFNTGFIVLMILLKIVGLL